MATSGKLPNYVTTDNDDIVCQAIDDELVLLKLSSQQYYGLGEIGTRAWRLLSENGDVVEATRRLCDEYQGDPAVIQSDFHELLEELIDAGLIRAAGVQA